MITIMITILLIQYVAYWKTILIALKQPISVSLNPRTKANTPSCKISIFLDHTRPGFFSGCGEH